MRPGSTGRRSHRGPAAAAALGLLLTAALGACDAPSPHEGARAGVSASPSPSPSPVPRWDPSPASLAAVGDSITTGFDTCRLLADCPEASWATGTDADVDSLGLRLLGAEALGSRSWNLAESGADASDLPAQMARAAARRPELVTVMVGANDACADTLDRMTPVESFRDAVEEAMKVLRESVPGAQVYMASVPDLKHLWATGRDDPLGRGIWQLGICATMLADARDDGPQARERREAVHRRVIAYNTVLREVCEADERCRHDGGRVFGFRFGKEQLSRWDWFHPSRDGQRRLAEIAYRAVTAPRAP
ncbi:SGNH/GDSL hydrolase family protein [Streptomyces sanyensis]|uniref:SGNH/GDSL hydrolase family protein n=1 Tax=Streptomyces sanyensis TaxID=568869 RepID=UPI003D77742C